MTDLTKWPRLLVVGDSVPVELAEEILVRTDGWWLSSNDRPWVAQVAIAVGLEVTPHGTADFKSVLALRERIGALDLSYLNNEQIVSSWVGGPHGWLDWSGQIGCSSWNIGKWPDEDEVADDWEKIAAAWPQLRLCAQLIPDEGDAPKPAVQFDLLGNGVRRHYPEHFLRPPTMVDIDPLSFLLRNSGRERGNITPERLASIVERLSS